MASLIPDATPEANVPDLPADLVKCTKRPLCTEVKKDEEPRTADQLVLDCAKSDEERRVCSRQLLAHYDKIKKANAPKKAPEPAKSVAKKKTAALEPKIEP